MEANNFTSKANNFTSKLHPTFVCEKCTFKCSKSGDWNRHVLTAKHHRLTNANNFTSNANKITSNYIKAFLVCICSNEFKHLSSLSRHRNKCELYQNIFADDNESQKFNTKNIKCKNEQKRAKTSKNEQHILHCQYCDYTTSRNINFERHLQTMKHKTCKTSKNEQNVQNEGAEKYQIYDENLIVTKDQITPELVLKVVEQNCELIQVINKLVDNKTTVTNGNNNISNCNNNNKHFNLQFFLNETCKDAMNISDFVSSIKVSIDDLENTGRQGYIQGISNIIIKNLNKLEQHLRPLHCSDYKREILYIKDNDEWLKETDNKPILTKAIKTIANENIKQIGKWRDNYPDCTDSDSIKNDLYLKIVSNSMNGLTKEESDKNINKIIANVAKNVVIEK
jgi:hypothetical protein